MNDKFRFDDLYIYEGEEEIGFFGWEGEELFVNLYVILRVGQVEQILTEMKRLIAERNKSPFCTFDE
jgi:hypothetical protein